MPALASGRRRLLVVLAATCAALASARAAAAETLPPHLRAFEAHGEELASATTKHAPVLAEATSAQQHGRGTMVQIAAPETGAGVSGRPPVGPGALTGRSGGAGFDKGKVMLRDAGTPFKAHDISQRGIHKLLPAEGAREKRSSRSAPDASSFAQRLSQARADAQASIAAQKRATPSTKPKCDGGGCWMIDTTNPATRATLAAFHGQVSHTDSGAQAVVAERSGGTSSAGALHSSAGALHESVRGAAHKTHVLDSQPVAPALQAKCDNPYHHVETAEEACTYVRRRCQQRSGIFNYQALCYCTLGGSPGLAVGVLLVWLVALCIWLSMAADLFLCPCLTVMSKMCKMSENVAGLTFLALGNGAPDIFSQIAASIASPRGAEMALGEMLGSSLIIAGLVFAIVAILVPFRVNANEFVRDVVFLLISLVFLFLILLDSAISMWEALGFIVLYSVYLYVAIFDVGKYLHPSLAAEQDSKDGELPSAWGHAKDTQDDGGARSQLLGAGEVSGKGDGIKDNHGRKSHPAGDGILWSELINYLNPSDLEELMDAEANWLQKLSAGAKMPLVVLMRLSSPVVDKSVPGEGWCKSAVVVQVFLAPILLVWCTLLHSMPAMAETSVHLSYGISAVVGLLLSVAVYMSSTNHTPPAYHGALAFLGFVTSIAWIYALAAELIHLLQTMGAIVDVSDTLMGLTVLAFANSVGDLVANLAMAKAGMPGMAAGACIGAPTLNLLLGCGSATLLGNLLVESPYPFELNLQLYVSLLFLVFILIAMLLYVFSHKFEVGRSFGFILIAIYFAFIITCLGLEVWGGRALLTANIGPDVRAGNFDLRNVEARSASGKR